MSKAKRPPGLRSGVAISLGVVFALSGAFHFVGAFGYGGPNRPQDPLAGFWGALTRLADSPGNKRRQTGIQQKRGFRWPYSSGNFFTAVTCAERLDRA